VTTEGTSDQAGETRHKGFLHVIEPSRHPRLDRDDITVTDEAAVKRAVKAAALGNAMEWFDFGIYSYLAVTLGKVFFPSGNGTVSLLSSFATFAVAFLVRPVGGSVLGPLGDRVGRKRVLALTMIMMAFGTFGIGLIPGYAAIGFWAPVLLITLRLVQGFSTGGEYGGASTFIAEYAPDKRRGFFGSFLEFGTLSGYVAASGLVVVLTSVLSDSSMVSWGWRIPFLVAGPLGGIGLYLRLKLDETPAFQRLESQSAARTRGAGPGEGEGEGEGAGGSAVESVPHGARPPGRSEFRQIFVSNWRRLVLCVALVAAYNVTDYALLSYMPTYLSDELKYSTTHGLVVLLAVMVVMMGLINQVGRLNDRYGRRPVLMAGMLGSLVLSVPAFLLVRQGGLPAIIAGIAMLGFSLLCLLGTMSAALPALFPTHVRYGALSIGYNLSTSVFGGTTPLVITALISATGSKMVPAYYCAGFAVIGVVAVALMPESAQQPLEGSPPAVATPEEAAEIVRPATPTP
jgi:MFS transporter, MHS family, proline/betaine transporter